MPLNQDNIIQYATGSFEAVSGTVSLPATTTAGSTVIVFATIDGDHVNTKNLGIISGGAGTWLGLSTAPASLLWNALRVYAKRNVAAGENNWNLPTLGSGSARQVVWAVFELTGVGIDPYDVPSGLPIGKGWFASPIGDVVNNADTAVSSLSSGTTEGAACYDLLGFAAFGATGTSTTIPVFSGLTNNWTEIASASRVNATQSLALSVAILPSVDVAQFETTVSVSPTSYMSGYALMLYADGAKFVPDFIGMFGAEIGTENGITAGSLVAGTPNPTAPWDTVTGTPTIVSTNPRSGNYCLELSSTSAAECLTWAYNGVLYSILPDAAYVNVGRFHVYFPTSLPSADTELWGVEAVSSANGMTVWFRAASSKIGIKIGTGTEILSDATVSANTWIGIDYRYRTVDTNHTCDWQIDYDSLDGPAPVTQTQAVGASTTSDYIRTVRCGWANSHTSTVRYDDIAVSKIWGTYPIGDIRILPLKVDSVGTPTVVGSEANFKTFTNNGTMATWTAAATKTAIDDIPPTVGASSDGVAQVSVATDVVRIPMETYTAAPNYVLRGLRWYVAGWAASTNPATMLLNSSDGTSQLMQVAIGDHGFDDTTLRWLCGMHRNLSSRAPYVLSQTKLDAAYIEFGGSTDANPDVGIISVLGELAIQPAIVYGSSNIEGGAFQIYVRQDPSSASMASILVTTPPGTRGATAFWTINSVDDSHYVGPNTTWEKLISASSVGEVTVMGLNPDPTV
jgi:hypothetical protein